MTIGLAIATYTALVAVVSSLMIYYFRVMRPNEEKQSND
jgi:preprotein translocase subunit YajC